MRNLKAPIGQSGEILDNQLPHETAPTKAVIVHPSSNQPKDPKRFKQAVQDIVTVLGMIKVLIEIAQLFL